MLVNAMEAAGIEGNFRTTCECVMSVLRENHDNLMAVLEAFVYDPLINWRLLTFNQMDSSTKQKKPIEMESEEGVGGGGGGDAGVNTADRDESPLSPKNEAIPKTFGKFDSQKFAFLFFFLSFSFSLSSLHISS
jgi:FKBP12-rapamycin complex-associated protein